MKVVVLTGPQGCGKSMLMREEAIAKPGLYLFAVPTIELAQEQADDFRSARPTLDVRQVHSKSGGRGAVKRRLLEAREELEEQGARHAVLIITHEAMMDADLSSFEGWHARIDEAPAAIQAGQMNIAVSRPFFESTFVLETRDNDEWALLSMAAEKPNWKAVSRDKLLGGIVEFVKQAGRDDRVFVRTPDWAADDIDWFSIWTPMALDRFASVTIAGSAYTSSIGYRTAKDIFKEKLDFEERPVDVKRTGDPSISIQYFTDSHQGTTTFWGKSDGRLCIKQVCDHLADALDEGSFWSGNEVVQHLMEHRVPGVLIPPVACGINKHRERMSCAIIYSAKATKDDGPVMSIFDLSKDDIRHAREDDAIAQFVMRGAIRNADYGGPYTIFVYEKEQAERLAMHLAKIHMPNVAVAGVPEAGLMSVKREQSMRQRSPEERAQADDDRRKSAAARMKRKRHDEAVAAGRTPGTPGNPKLRKASIQIDEAD